MAKSKIIIDCDPGVDDAIALLLAFASPDEIELVGITTVIGNVSLPLTTRNALRVTAMANRQDVPVYAGCSRPIVLPRVQRGASVHGTDGLGDLGVPDATHPIQGQHAVDFIIDTILREPGEITLCPIGPMTNIALALIKEPSIAAKIKQIVFMGGAAFSPGNTATDAEFNIWIDPHAAQVVLSSGIPMTMFGLDVTRHATLTKARFEELERDASPLMKTAIAMMRYYGSGDASLHDPCVTAFLIDPTLFEGVDAVIDVDLDQSGAYGRTCAVENGNGSPIHVITEVDDERLFRLIDRRLRLL
ncbi:nucleoside hydrolase [Mesorhizobium humile]|uniref:Nucleoside hydrolase n=1 Tax=Mesorhizobium humile TaxID=3072313 RepID=A0ABU4YPN3_9HYPH|nr:MULTISPECIES: nucleoside hydrolase [unclassified Mesorhizobium]MDX8461328.1 nucleoside hydrolase [Mesorhizobium sp. VK2D]MDX8488938.1 nucleoside hydrolase [Mesorhizobium sp. VK2B]